MSRVQKKISLQQIGQTNLQTQRQYIQLKIKRVRSQIHSNQFQFTTNCQNMILDNNQEVSRLVQSQIWQQIQKKYGKEYLKKTNPEKQVSFSSQDTDVTQKQLSKILIRTIIDLKKKISQEKNFYESKINLIRSQYKSSYDQLKKSISNIKNSYLKKTSQCYHYLQQIRQSQEGWGISLKNIMSKFQSKQTQLNIHQQQSIKQILNKELQKAIQIVQQVPVRVIMSKSVSQPIFKLQQNKITFNGHIQGTYRQHVRNVVIPNQTQFSFNLKVINSIKDSIMIGIVIKKRKGQRSSYESGQAIVYSGKGIVYYGPEMKKRSGGGFNQGDIVMVKVNLKKDNIEWYTNNVLQVKHKIGLFRFQKLCPYIQMLSKGDIVQWL